MISCRLTRRKAAAAAAVEVEWADLPAELLGNISGALVNRGEIVGFRSVCRSWRSSTPPPPNKLSPLFPCKAPFFGEPYPYYDPMITANAVYLVRPRSDPSKAWLASLQEAAPGKLILRHALTYREMNGDAGPDLDEDWIASTQTLITQFYRHNKFCPRCNGVDFTQKVVFLRELGSGSGCSQLVGLCGYPYGKTLAFRLDLADSGGFEATPVIRNFEDAPRHERIADFVKFNGRIFAIDLAGHIYVLDHTKNLQLVQMTEKPVREYVGGWLRIRFVVSDGDLYAIRISKGDLNPAQCEIFRLKVVLTDGNNNNNKCSGILCEKVEDLGDRAFFLTTMCSFSIPARLLPHPWQEGNRIFFTRVPESACRCARGDAARQRNAIFHVASQTFSVWDPQGLSSSSDLFTTPASLVEFVDTEEESNPSPYLMNTTPRS